MQLISRLFFFGLIILLCVFSRCNCEAAAAGAVAINDGADAAAAPYAQDGAESPKTSSRDAVEDALAKAKTESHEAMTDGTQGDADSNAPPQAAYPGIVNKNIQAGGDGKPVSSIWYPETGNADVDADLREFAKTITRQYEDEVREVEKDGNAPEMFSEWEQTGFFTISRPSAEILSVTFNIYSYLGGAHGQIVICVLNYDLKTGRRLEFADLFADTGKALQIMSEISARTLTQNLGEDAEEEMIRDGTEPTDGNFANLSLLPQGLAVEFQPYQVGPWSIGQQHVDISLQELAPAGPSPNIWPPADAATGQ